MIVKGYEINVYQAYSIHEQGKGYSWESWGSDTDYYKAEEIEIPIEIAKGFQLAESNGGSILLYPGALDLNEAIQAKAAKVLLWVETPADVDPDNLPDARELIGND